MTENTATNLTLSDWAQQLQRQQISSVELTQHYLTRIATYNSNLNAVIAVDPEQSLAQARVADEMRQTAQAKNLPLLGLPILHKDIFVTRNWPTTAGSKMLANYRSPFDATAVAQLQRAGMVTLGKTNCDEFAMGSANEHSFFGPTHNPWQLGKVPGGSSGGSAAAVAADLCPVSTGTDTGGSIRQPAALCGITGIKPTYGRVSRYGMIAYASSLDQGGVLAHNAADCALVLEAMAGADQLDSTSLQLPIPAWSKNLQQPLTGKRLGFLKPADGLQAEVAQAIDAALGQWQRLGATLVEIELPYVDLAVAAYYIVATAEASSNLSRFDGVRYGHRAANYDSLAQMYSRSRSEGFGPEVQRRILLGTYVLSHGYYDAYYRQAQKIRRLIANSYQQAFTQCDVLVTPVCPTTAWSIGAHQSDPTTDYLADAFTLPINLAGLPAMSVPCGFDAQGLPIGAQLIGNYLDEASLLALAHQYQQTTDWHQRRPNLKTVV